MQASIAARANDFIITECAAHGTLQINEFMPLLAWALLDTIDLLNGAGEAFAEHVAGIVANPARCAELLNQSPTLLTAFLPHVGYDKASALVKEYKVARAENPSLNIRAFLSERFGEEMVNKVLSLSNLTSLGYKE